MTDLPLMIEASAYARPVSGLMNTFPSLKHPTLPNESNKCAYVELRSGRVKVPGFRSTRRSLPVGPDR